MTDNALSLPLTILGLLAVLSRATTPALAQAAAPVLLPEIGEGVRVAVGSTGEGEYLMAWQDPATRAIRGQRISAGGIPDPNGLELVSPLAFEIADPALDFSISGRGALLWTQTVESGRPSVGGVILDSSGSLTRLFEIPNPGPDPDGSYSAHGPSVTALPGGGFAIAWTRCFWEDRSSNPLKPTDCDAYAARIDENGYLIGAAVQIHAESERLERASDIIASDNSLVVAWSSGEHYPDQKHFVRVLGHALHPRSDQNLVEALWTSPLAVLPDGQFVVGSGSFGFQPADRRAQLQFFHPDGSPKGPPFQLSPEGQRSQGAAGVVLTCEGILWTRWLEVHDVDGEPGGLLQTVVMSRSFSSEGVPLTAPAELVRIGLGDLTITGGIEGTLVTWTSTSSSPFRAVQVVGRRSSPAAPPAELSLTNPELPGFLAWVRIADQDLAAVWATEVPCLRETLCAAGRLPDRAEVMIRVVGPKPNGLLWPTIVRLTTSRVEVWLEQVATGEVRYYLLPGAPPGSELLPGLFDRTGFDP